MGATAFRPSRRRRLRTQVSRLRSRLGTGGAAASSPGDEGYRLDVGEGAASMPRSSSTCLGDDLIDDAIGLWRGRALGEFADRDFALGPAPARLEELRLGALEHQAANALTACGRSHDAVAAPRAAAPPQHPGREHARKL